MSGHSIWMKEAKHIGVMVHYLSSRLEGCVK